MRIDLSRALFSHCEYELEDLRPTTSALLEVLVQRVVGACIRPTKVATYLQSAVTLLEYDHEFRAHLWFDLPEGHPDFRTADRGLAWIIRPVCADGLYGPTLGGLGWLGHPLHPMLRLNDGDWISEMIQAQGYLEVPGAEWEEPLENPNAKAVLAGLLGPHLEGMTNHVILEERLGWR